MVTFSQLQNPSQQSSVNVYGDLLKGLMEQEQSAREAEDAGIKGASEAAGQASMGMLSDYLGQINPNTIGSFGTISENPNEEEDEEKSTGKKIGGAAAGALQGAQMGSFAGPIGTGVGATLGALGGWFL